MSLINDALRRASQMDRNRPIEAEAPKTTRPAPPKPSPVLPGLIALAFALVGLGAGGYMLSKIFGWGKTESSPEPPPMSAVTNAPPRKPVITIVTEPPPRTNIMVISPPPVRPAPASPTTNTTEDEFPQLKLQAIFYSRTDPHALINGRTIEEGDQISGARIEKITKETVTVQWNGEVRQLKMDVQ